MAAYLDSSALLRLAVAEPESPALRRALAGRDDVVSSALAIVEVVRAARPHGPAALERAWALLADVALLELDEDLLRAAADLGGALRTLDAIHLASAKTLRDIDAFIAYDARLLAAAEAAGLPVGSPGRRSQPRAVGSRPHTGRPDFGH